VLAPQTLCFAPFLKIKKYWVLSLEVENTDLRLSEIFVVRQWEKEVGGKNATQEGSFCSRWFGADWSNFVAI
jgi:hypothetical protein